MSVQAPYSNFSLFLLLGLYDPTATSAAKKISDLFDKSTYFLNSWFECYYVHASPVLFL